MASESNIEITTQNGWNQWSKYVLKELERLNESILRSEKTNAETSEKLNIHIDNKVQHLDNKIENINKDIISLKIKSAGWGFLAGTIPVVIGIILWLIENVTLK